MAKMMLAHHRKKKKEKLKLQDSKDLHADFNRESKVLEQEINVEELKHALTMNCGWTDRDKRTIEKLLQDSENGFLSVEYTRVGGGRWYAKGLAQLQSCKRHIREKALKRNGIWG